MITQIYSIINKEEALACIEAGADHIGLAAGYKDQLPCGLTLQEGKEIFEAIGTKAKKDNKFNEIMKRIKANDKLTHVRKLDADNPKTMKRCFIVRTSGKNWIKYILKCLDYGV